MSDNSDFAGTTSAQVQSLVGDIQAEQERRDSLMYMRRLEPFLDSMQKFNEAAKDTATFSDLPQAMAYVWVRVDMMVMLRPSHQPPISRWVGTDRSHRDRRATYSG